MDRWKDALQVAVVAAVVVALELLGGPPDAADAVTVLVAVAAVLSVSPWNPFVRHTDRAAALAGAGPRDVVAYWRQGCTWCVALRWQLRGVARVTWVNVLRDPHAEAFVRSVQDGDMLTPTVTTATDELLDPTAEAVREHLAGPATA